MLFKALEIVNQVDVILFSNVSLKSLVTKLVHVKLGESLLLAVQSNKHRNLKQLGPINHLGFCEL